MPRSHERGYINQSERMKIKESSNFEACPEFTGKGVCVDVTPLRKQQSQYGERNVFKIVFEVDMEAEDGKRYSVWSNNFTPTLNEKASLRKFLRGWFGRDLSKAELEDFDTETLIGKPAQLVVVHQHKDGKVYGNIAACTPDKSGEPLKPSGKFVRVKDRAKETGDRRQETGGGYRRAEQPAESGSEHASVKVHVGKCKGLELRDLAAEQIEALVQHWLPGAKANPKPLADDKRLIAALEWWQAARAQQEDDVAY
jgi:hypothetical protein